MKSFEFGFVMLVVLTSLYSSSSAATWHVKPDGTGDAVTIQAGIDMAVAPDTVLVAYGTYYEHDVMMKSGITLQGDASDPASVIIDAQQLGSVIHCDNVGGAARIIGLTVTNGMYPGGVGANYGGGIHCESSSPRIEHCVISHNTRAGIALWHESSPYIYDCLFEGNVKGPYGWGSGVFSHQGSSPSISYCVFIDNESTHGGGVSCMGFEESRPSIDYCVFLRNSATYGGGIHFEYGAEPFIKNCTLYMNSATDCGGGICCAGHSYGTMYGTIKNTVIASCTQGQAVECYTFTCHPLIYCSNFWGNEGGDWVGCVATQRPYQGNFSLDPQFCGIPGTDNLRLQEDSPCAPGNHPGGNACGLIGALPVGCGTVSKEKETWGAIKNRFRPDK